METESPVGTNLFAWLDTTCGVKNIYFWIFSNVQRCMCSIWMYKCDSAQPGIWVRARSHWISSPCFNNSDIQFHSVSQTYHFLYKYHILSATVCFYFPQRQLPLAGWLTAVCACIIISFTEPVCCRSLWQTSVTQYTVYRNYSHFHRVLHFCCCRCGMLNMNHCRWTCCPSCLEQETCKIRYNGANKFIWFSLRKQRHNERDCRC